MGKIQILPAGAEEPQEHFCSPADTPAGGWVVAIEGEGGYVVGWTNADHMACAAALGHRMRTDAKVRRAIQGKRLVFYRVHSKGPGASAVVDRVEGVSIGLGPAAAASSGKGLCETKDLRKGDLLLLVSSDTWRGSFGWHGSAAEEFAAAISGLACHDSDLHTALSTARLCSMYEVTSENPATPGCLMHLTGYRLIENKLVPIPHDNEDQS